MRGVPSLGWEDPLEEGMENPMDRGTWRAKVRGVPESCTTEAI